MIGAFFVCEGRGRIKSKTSPTKATSIDKSKTARPNVAKDTRGKETLPPSYLRNLSLESFCTPEMEGHRKELRLANGGYLV